MLGFDTLKAMESLKESGFEEAQAKAVVDTFKDALSSSVATQTDVEAAKTDLEMTMTQFKADLETAIVQLEARTQRFMFALAVGIVGLNVTLTFGVLKFFL